MLETRSAPVTSAPRVRPIPAIECSSLCTLKYVAQHSDAITVLPLTAIAAELEAGTMVLLGSKPWLHTRFGIVSLKGGAWNGPADRLREAVARADADLTREEATLAQRRLR